jgi:uncharacterized protein YjdB
MRKILYLPAFMLLAALPAVSCSSDEPAVTAIAIEQAKYVSADNVMRIALTDTAPLQLTPHVMPREAAANVSLIYENKHPELMSVSQGGMLTAIKVGVDTLTVKTADERLAVRYQVSITSYLVKATTPAGANL